MGVKNTVLTKHISPNFVPNEVFTFNAISTAAISRQKFPLRSEWAVFLANYREERCTYVVFIVPTNQNDERKKPADT